MRSYFITEEQFVRGSVHAFARTRRRLMAALFLLPLVMVPLLSESGKPWLELVILYVVLALMVFGVAPYLNRWLFRRIYRKNPLLHKEQFFEITEDGLHLRAENGESRYRFSELHKVQVYPEMVLVYPMTTLFHMLPRELLTEAELALLSRVGVR